MGYLTESPGICELVRFPSEVLKRLLPQKVRVLLSAILQWMEQLKWVTLEAMKLHRLGELPVNIKSRRATLK